MGRRGWMIVFAAWCLASTPALASSVSSGGGSGQFARSMDESPGEMLSGKVNIFTTLSSNLGGGVPSMMVRLQFVRPDEQAVAFAVWTLPNRAPVPEQFTSGMDEVEFVYYELRSGGDGEVVFEAQDWAGTIEVARSHHIKETWNLTFEFEVTSHGPDAIAGTADDAIRKLSDGTAYLSPEPVSIPYGPSGSTAGPVYSDNVVVYYDGCSGSPDYDYDYYDSDSDDYDSDDDYDGSCDGDTYDDDDDYDSGDDWGDDGWDYEGDDYYLVRGMSWTGPLGRLLKTKWRRLARLMPLYLGFVFLLFLRIYSRKITDQKN